LARDCAVPVGRGQRDARLRLRVHRWLVATLSCATAAISTHVTNARANVEAPRPALTAARSIVSVGQRDPGSGEPHWRCRGVLTAPWVVVTAAHCLARFGNASGKLETRCGGMRLQKLELEGRLVVALLGNDEHIADEPVAVSTVALPEVGTDLCEGDVAVAVLEHAVSTTAAAPVRLRQQALDRDVRLWAEPCRKERGAARLVRMRILCVGVACPGDYSGPDEWLAEGSTCRGNSGSPALDDEGRVVGLLSRGKERGQYGVYIKLESWRSVIERLGQRATQASNGEAERASGGSRRVVFVELADKPRLASRAERDDAAGGSLPLVIRTDSRSERSRSAACACELSSAGRPPGFWSHEHNWLPVLAGALCLCRRVRPRPWPLPSRPHGAG
jgi:hypothetical protein